MDRNPFDPHDIDLDGAYILGRDIPNKASLNTYDYKHKIFYVEGKGSIDFKTKGGEKFQSTLWEIILERWQQNESKPVTIHKDKIISKVAERLGEAWDRDKLRWHLRHLIKKVKAQKQFEDVVLIKPKGNDDVIFNCNVPVVSINNL